MIQFFYTPKRYRKRKASEKYLPISEKVREKDPVPKKKGVPKAEPKKPSFDEMMAGVDLQLPEMIAPTRYATCSRCSVSVDMSVNSGRCTACGGRLSNR